MISIFINALISFGIIITLSTVELYAVEWKKYNKNLQSKEWTQYIEILPGVTSSNIKLNIDDNQSQVLVSSHDDTFNIGIGYGVKTNIFSFGLRGQASFFNTSITNNYVNGLGDVYSIHLTSIRTYSMLATAGVDIIRYQKYQATLVGGVGVALHTIKASNYSNGRIQDVSPPNNHELLPREDEPEPLPHNNPKPLPHNNHELLPREDEPGPPHKERNIEICEPLPYFPHRKNHQIYNNSPRKRNDNGLVFMNSNLNYNTTNYSVSNQEEDQQLATTFAFMVGLQQSYFITNNIALGIGVNYVNLGSPKYYIGDKKIELRTNGSLNVNFSISMYF